MDNYIKYFVYIVVALYALFTVVAALADSKERGGFQYWHSFYLIGSLVMLVAILNSSPKFLLPLALGFMVIIAIYNGKILDILDWRHIGIRALISLIISGLWFLA